MNKYWPKITHINQAISNSHRSIVIQTGGSTALGDLDQTTDCSVDSLAAIANWWWFVVDAMPKSTKYVTEKKLYENKINIKKKFRYCRKLQVEKKCHKTLFSLITEFVFFSVPSLLLCVVYRQRQFCRMLRH